MNAADLPGAFDREIDMVMLVMSNPGPGLHERQRLETLTCRCGYTIGMYSGAKMTRAIPKP